MIHDSPDSRRAALLLTNRLVSLDVKPLVASEFWELAERVDPGELLELDPDGIAERAGVGVDDGRRIRSLLDAATAFSFEQERLHDGGIALLSAFDEQFPAAVRDRLARACPPFLLVAGPFDRLTRPGLGIVGEVGGDDPDDAMLAIARNAARLAVVGDWCTVGGFADGVEAAAMSATFEAGGTAVGVPAEGILRASRTADLRRHVHDGRLCIVSPYAPDARATAASAVGRTKVVYALAQLTFVVAAARSAGVASGATDAIDGRYGVVAVWAGAGAPPGNRALTERGASAITALPQLFEVDTALPPQPPQPLQVSLF